MKDANLVLRSGATDVTADANETGVDFGGADKGNITYELTVPEVGGTTPTLDCKIQESDDDSTYTNFLQFPQINAVGVYRVTGKSDKRYRRLVIDVGGTNPDFGAVKCYPTFGGRYTKF